MKLIYQLTKEGRQARFVEIGVMPAQVQAVELDPTTLTPDDRRLLLVINPQGAAQAALTLPSWGVLGPASLPFEVERIATDAESLWRAYVDARHAAQAAFDVARETALEDSLGYYRERYQVAHGAPASPDTSRFRSSPRWPELVAAYEAAKVARAEWERAYAAKESARKEAEQAERERRDAERTAWIREHGSSYLRKCLDGGYDCQRRYVIERAAQEFDGAWDVDYFDRASWKDRAGPSEAALDLAASVGGTVVWLTGAPVSDLDIDREYSGDFEPCEAVVVRKFLGQYDVIYYPVQAR